MKIALIGYGKMGREIEAVAIARGHEITLKITSENLEDLAQLSPENVDVAIEFSSPESAVTNIEECIAAKVPVVVGTTGWYDNFKSIEAQVKKENTALFYATNFSVGVNLFWKMCTQIAKLMGDNENYDALITEVHHTGKLDVPSGTAITTAERILKEQTKLKSWESFEEDIVDDVDDDKLPIVSVREEDVPGTHVLSYTSEIDEIDLMHTAFNRKGFATGAVLAAEFLQNKKGVFSMDDLVESK
ncbi:MAG: 4-hydroxy-tetrahydrodipicolinate reductase [Sphingobacteriales bacterium]|jgi:4-hydroxy-tetrahydrodipicolinate reductase